MSLSDEPVDRLDQLSTLAIKRLISRIESDLEDAKTGFSSPGAWYARDRLLSLHDVLSAALAGDENACCVGAQVPVAPEQWDA